MKTIVVEKTDKFGNIMNENSINKKNFNNDQQQQMEF